VCHHANFVCCESGRTEDFNAALREVEPTKDFSKTQIEVWLDSLKAAPDEKAIHLLIERIDVMTKRDFNITSTLKSVLGEIGCEGSQHSLPAILFWYLHSSPK